MTTRPSATIDAVLTGRAVDYTRPGSRSAIGKRAVEGPVRIGPEGLAGDEQGDRRVHGGPDKAIHHYPRDHYASWQGEVGAHALLQAAGAFGENISTAGITEADVCLGDRLRLGSAAPELMAAYRAGTLALDQLMAFCVSEDQDRQRRRRSVCSNSSPSSRPSASASRDRRGKESVVRPTDDLAP